MFLPPTVRAAVVAPLADLDPGRRELFELRLERWWTDLRDGIEVVFPGEAGQALLVDLVGAAARAYAERDPELHRLDQERTLAPDWFQQPHMLGYAAYAERFAGDLDGVRGSVDYLRELGVTYLHLMPLLRPRDGDNDGGYAVADFRTVRPDLGTMADLRAVADRAAARGHQPGAGPRAQPRGARARVGPTGSGRRAALPRLLPRLPRPHHAGRVRATLWEVFPDFAPGSFTWDDDVQGWVWTTFHSWQWDLNWSNPHVFAELVDVVLFLANQGVEVFRLDAIAFLWKRMGTSCQNQPEVHALTQAMRAVARIACPAVAFKAEAIVGPSDLVQYLGTGTHHGKVSDLAYHNGLMVQVWSMLAAKDTTLATHALRALPPIPTTTAWVTYVRCHDDIGWAISDEDAAAVGLDGHRHRQFLSDWYAGTFEGSDARGLVFQYNAATGDRRISGTAASLVGLEAARAAQDPAWIDAAISRLLLAHALVLGWGGVPVLWSGDELGLPNDPAWATEPGHADDNRWAHRPRLDPAVVALKDVPGTVEARVFGGLQHLARVRASLPHLNAAVTSEVLGPDDPGVLTILRRHPLGPMLAAYNVTGDWRAVPGWRLRAHGVESARDALTGERIDLAADDSLWLGPWRAVWLT